jgi:hypothetical protein
VSIKITDRETIFLDKIIKSNLGVKMNSISFNFDPIFKPYNSIRLKKIIPA